MMSGVILEDPLYSKEKIHKGAIILSSVDEFIKIIPELRTYYYIIERRGWCGINDAEYADIKLVEDSSYMDETRKKFPNALLLDIGPADFVDTEKFKPLGIDKVYSAIQIARWDRFKRHHLIVKAASLIPEKKFIKFGHFAHGGSLEEILLKEENINAAEHLRANIKFLHVNINSNKGLPYLSEEVNFLINQCKMGILTSKVEGINRFKMECLSADIPMLVPSDTSFPTKKHINDKTGIFYEPNPLSLKMAIEYVEANYATFSPRSYVLSNSGLSKSIEKLRNALNTLAQSEGLLTHYQNITWDGRNQSLIWGYELIERMRSHIKLKCSY